MSKELELGMRIGTILRGALSKARAFPKAKRGNVAMIFGLSLIPLALAAGVGLDMSRAMITRARMGNALDAAGLAVGSQPGMSQDDMQKLAEQYFKQNYTADQSQYGTPTDVHLQRDGQTITLSTSVHMPTTLMNIVGIKTMSVAASSQITWGQTKLWVALVLDNTGSMCEPDSCAGTNNKISALKTALTQANTGLFDILKNAASNDGDVKVSIVPFSKDVNVGLDKVSDGWIDWTNWDSAPPSSTPASTVGPGSNCPYGTNTSPYGYPCMISPVNSSRSISVIPTHPFPWDASIPYVVGNQVTNGGIIYYAIKAGTNHAPPGATTYWVAQTADYTGYICPGTDNGKYNSGNGVNLLDAASHHYNGCYTSTPTNTLVTTATKAYTRTDNYSCSQVGNGTITCGATPSSTSNSTASVTLSTATTSGYSGDVAGTWSAYADGTPGSPTDGSKSCKTKNGVTTCTWTRTIKTPVSATEVNKSGAGPFNHAWVSNNHSTWDGCIMDRDQDDDTKNTDPATTKFPAENTDYCLPGTIAPLGYDWSTMVSQVNALSANGNTNQTIGLAWGWQTLTDSDPFNPGDLPVDTKRYVILLTDGLNTQNRSSGTQTTIDARTQAACQHIQDDGIIIYTVYVNLNPPATKDPGQVILENCATGGATGGKFFALTQASQIPDTFQTIATQITNLRVSL